MTKSLPGDRNGDLSRRTRFVVVVMLVAILLPPAIVSLPVSKMVVRMVNTGDKPISTVYVYLEGYSDDYFTIETITPGNSDEGSFNVRPGYHSVRIVYHVEIEEYNYSVHETWGQYELLPFETETHEFELSGYGYY